ncbi:hypothetical protein GCM10009767_14950 [Kocuria aegyptia]|uniref:Uncharacterized protein n=1 Tax=Kocuria aegyptia TaxID=330943 RepID=A0ABN2KHX0_9MICC
MERAQPVLDLLFNPVVAVARRRSCEKPLATERLTPARVRRGFRQLHAETGQPASARGPPVRDQGVHPE